MALTLKNVASDLASALNGQTVGGVALSSNANLFSAKIHPMPQGLVVQLINTAGPPPMPFISATASALYRANVDCTIYGMPGQDGFEAAETLSRGVAGYLHQLVPSGYISVFVREGSPRQEASDPETQRWVFKISLEAIYSA